MCIEVIVCLVSVVFWDTVPRTTRPLQCSSVCLELPELSRVHFTPSHMQRVVCGRSTILIKSYIGPTVEELDKWACLKVEFTRPMQMHHCEVPIPHVERLCIKDLSLHTSSLSCLSDLWDVPAEIGHTVMDMMCMWSSSLQSPCLSFWGFCRFFFRGCKKTTNFTVMPLGIFMYLQDGANS